MSAPPEILRLCAAGEIASVARVGYEPFDVDDPIEITFADGAIHHVDIGFVGATDIQVHESTLLEHAFGHLRTEEPDTWASIERDWTREEINLPWLVGQRLSNPRRLAMTNPYRVEVGYVFDAGERSLAIFGEADLIHIAALDDPDIAGYGLEIVPYSAA